VIWCVETRCLAVTVVDCFQLARRISFRGMAPRCIAFKPRSLSFRILRKWLMVWRGIPSKSLCVDFSRPFSYHCPWRSCFSATTLPLKFLDTETSSACDNTISATVVVADCRIILVNDNINTDLFWAIRCKLSIMFLAWLVLTNITQLEVRHRSEW
jgi:hypothetical protein